MIDYEKYADLPDKIEQFYNKQKNIDPDLKQKYIAKFDEIEVLKPRVKVLLNAINACLKFDYKIFDDFNTGDICIDYNIQNKANSIQYTLDNRKFLRIDGVYLLLFNGRLTRKPEKYILDFTKLLDTFEKEYYEFEEKIYKRIEKLIEQ